MRIAPLVGKVDGLWCQALYVDSHLHVLLPPLLLEATLDAGLDVAVVDA